MTSNINKAVALVFLSYSLIMPFSFADTKVDASKYTVKCHVDIENGRSIISLWEISHNKLTEFEKSIVGAKVLTEKSLDEFVIVKTHECALESRLFNSAQANLLDKKTAR
jgi:hypothetical protein